MNIIDTSFDIKSLQKLSAVSKIVSSYISSGDLVLIYGAIGVGKTTFVKKIVQNKINKFTNVTSPTFSIMNEYENIVINSVNIKHLDMYRITDVKCMPNIEEVIESLIEKKSIVLVEWPNILIEWITNMHVIATNIFEVILTKDLQNNRTLKIKTITE